MAFNLHNRSFLKLLDFTPREIRFLLDLSRDLKRAKYGGYEQQHMRGKNIAIIFEKASTRTRVSFEVAAYDQGAHVTYLGPSGSQIGHKESMKDTARVLGRIFDGIEYRGFDQEIVEQLAQFAGVPVWNGLTDEFHPTQILADFLTMTEFSDKPLTQISYCYLGDAREQHGRLADGRWCEDGHGRAAVRAEGPLARRGPRRRVPDHRRTDRRSHHAQRRPGQGGQGRRLPVHRRVGLDGRGQVGLGRARQAPQAVPGQRATS